jgi:hypothetical protein
MGGQVSRRQTEESLSLRQKEGIMQSYKEAFRASCSGSHWLLSYSGGQDLENCGSRPALDKS